MPLYEYICPDCKNEFEKRVSIAEADQTACPNCGGQHTKRRLPRIAVQFHGVSSSFPAVDSGSTCSSGSCCGGTCGLGDFD
ncbi:MAG: zinc ribbon domain-containing protein [Anaerolineae bacterium]|nr:zinc ribbon domain-containing protein [Anaerolineae bacterium]